MGQLFGGGESSPQMPASNPYIESSSGDETTMMMLEMMMSQMAEQQVPNVPQALVTPQVYSTPEVDWTEKQAQLAAKAKGDFASSQEDKRGRLQTILTSPLEEEPNTNSSLIA